MQHGNQAFLNHLHMKRPSLLDLFIFQMPYEHPLGEVGRSLKDSDYFCICIPVSAFPQCFQVSKNQSQADKHAGKI